MVSSEFSSDDKSRYGSQIGERGAHHSVQDWALDLWHHVKELLAPDAMEKEKSFCVLATVSPQVTNHMEYHLNLEMRRTTCPRLETGNCTFQEGELYKVLGESAWTQKQLVFGGVVLWF